ncbi:hypothetical protein [Deinococcus hopiensis]|uniref:hypothetical protein n=1 Tax=Deinococcus hopiensis TaxID=309885 RepID=UPI000A07565C|nr:hypothetical protein [Deinococcus hopiensis]
MSSEAAELLCRPDVACLLKPFMRGERTVGQAAVELGVPLGTLHYRVGRFCREGLLELVREQSRRGRPCKVYRAAQSSFRIPASLLSDQTLQAMQHGRYWKEQVGQQLQYAPTPRLKEVVVELGDKGALQWTLNAQEGGAEPVEHIPGLLQIRSAALFLDPADAEAFAEELFELHQRYQSKRGAKRYGILCDLVPLGRPVDQGR